MSESSRREAALKAYDRFCVKQGFPRPEPEERHEDGRVVFIGTAADGRLFGIGYEIADIAVNIETNNAV